MLVSLRTFWFRARLGIIRRLVSIATRVQSWGAGAATRDIQALNSTNGLAQIRFSICQSCPRLSGPAPIERCTKCGCFMRAKTELLKAKCPEGRW